MKKILILLTATLTTLVSCDDLFKPGIENFKDVEQMYDDPVYALGFLVNVYRCIPGYYNNSEYGTDDAVTNQKTNSYLQMATGAWTASSYNPQNQWTNSYSSIQYINLFLENVDNVKWSDNEEKNALFNRRTKGEAYGLRGMFLYYLLRAHGGFTEDGELLGVPILTQYQTSTSDFNQPRATYQACVDQIRNDLTEAMKLLPYEYEDQTSVPEFCKDICTDVSNYNTVMGEKARQLFNGIIARAYLARTLNMAASPLFEDAGNTTTWADAADAAANVINWHGGLSSLASDGVEYYTASVVDPLKDGINPQEILWRENVSTSNDTQESQNYPPTLYGTGYMNPSQNLVDAFPMANGRPITDAASGYNASSPYDGRDPRLAKYIIYNGSTAGTAGKVIKTGSRLGTDDGINVREQTSTRTGYYMKKRLRMDVNCDPVSSTKQPHYTPRIRYTEMFLDYAEAANEAWGPRQGGSHAYSAYDVIKAIRRRAGVGGTDDPYLEECAASKEKMRGLIRNERRLELCFEGFRYWDLRRWKAVLNETVRGIDWNTDGTYTIFNVEERKYEDYMYFPPIPHSEILKYDNLKQNRGWK